ncbi:MAG: RNA polymerase sigma factor [Rhodospirillales bacterium]
MEIGSFSDRALNSAVEPSDGDLLAACRSGSLHAYEQLYRIHGGRMKNLAFHMLGDHADAEDAVQETFLKLYRGLDGFAGQSNFLSWVYRILINTCRDQQRRTRRWRPAALPELTAPAGVDPPLRIALRQALATLDERRRMVFVMFDVEGMRHAEIAAILDISDNASRSLLFEARQELRRMLKGKRL